MIPVLAIFIDSLKPESIDWMEFLSTFKDRARIKTELPSYSNPCHASIYTGVYPNKHRRLFVWKYAPQVSCFNTLLKLRVSNFHNPCFKRLIYFAFSKLRLGTVPYGYLFFEKHSINYWANFDFEMVKFWGNPEPFIGGYPTIFSILNNNNIEYQVIWSGKGSLRKIQIENPPTPFTYIFIGHMDPLSHKHGQESFEARRMLATIDNVLEQKYLEFEKKFGDEFVFMAFSDHGCTKVKERVDLYAFFKCANNDLNKYIHFIDSCYARFWFKNGKEKNEVEKVLNTLDNKGFILTDNILREYHAQMPDNRYGDLIFYLDRPLVFDVVNPKTNSMHGYLPNHSDSDGVIVTNRSVSYKSYVELEDITPSILYSIGLEIPDHVDGRPILK